MGKYGLADAVFNKARADLANDSLSTKGALIVPECPKCGHRIIQHDLGVALGNDLLDDQAVEKGADNRSARIS